MSPRATQAMMPRYHILLVGIDDYRDRPLGGCVNDIDAVQRLLLDRMGVPSDRIRRLASRHPGSARDPGAPVAERPATLDNLRHELAELGTARVARGDRVFLYFAGHGARIAVRVGSGRTYHREALVLADHDPARADSGLLYDFELNQALRAIAQQTHSVTLVLDCCHAAGVTRGPGELRSPEVLAESEPIARYLDLERMAAVPDPGPPPGDLDVPRALIAAAEHCHVVAACLGHEYATEECGSDGVRHGLLTSAWLAALDQVPGERLPAVRWSEIWHDVHAAVSQCNPAQHPRMVGNAARAVFAGPPVQHDPGIPVSPATSSASSFRIAAGTLANITKGAVLAVYGDQPLQFPPVGSDDDRRARIGRVRVTSAELATATAVPEGRAFELPPGARSRLVDAGVAARLRCAVIPRNAR
ncbi:MAG TPA: caspase family protein, partial [Kofleriaceae bacterium]